MKMKFQTRFELIMGGLDVNVQQVLYVVCGLIDSHLQNCGADFSGSSPGLEKSNDESFC